MRNQNVYQQEMDLGKFSNQAENIISKLTCDNPKRTCVYVSMDYIISVVIRRFILVWCNDD